MGPPPAGGTGCGCDLFTIFLSYIEGFSLGRLARSGPERDGVLDLRINDLRDCDHRRPVVGERRPPFGAGPGWSSPRPRGRRCREGRGSPAVAAPGPRGRRFDQSVAEEMAALAASLSGGFSLLCGRYEGVDERVVEHLVDGEISIPRLRPGRGGGGGPGDHRGRLPAPARDHGKRGVGHRGKAPAPVPPSIPTTPVPPSFGAGRDPQVLRNGDHRGSSGGGGPGPCGGR